MRKTWCVALALLALLLLVLLVVASQCPPTEETPTPEPAVSPTSEPIVSPTSEPTVPPMPEPTVTPPPKQPIVPIRCGDCSTLPAIQGTWWGKPYTVEQDDLFVKDQIIVAGYRDHIEQVIHTVPISIPVALTLVNTITLEYLEGHPGGNTYAEWGINLYSITSMESMTATDTVSEVRNAIYSLAAERGLVVFADPNYLTGRPSQAVWAAGDPYCPDCVEGDPAGISASAGHGLFWKQWALGVPGIRLFTNGESDPVAETGEGTRVVIFDTSPFKEQGEWAIPWVVPTLQLCVSHPGEVVPLDYEVNTPPGFSDHGLFVAGLVHAVAPGTKIHLVRVLNAQNQGDLDTLLNAINLLIRKALEEADGDDKNPLAGTVINLSLGVHPESKNLIEPLEAQLLIARACGAVVVAAAGNDSSGAAKPMQYPAAYTSVIGVAGSNIGGARACFSNRGDVAAPSGDHSDKDEVCGMSMVKQCSRTPDQDCDYCLISLVTSRTSETGYAFWTGTSFAAPLVSGQAALLLERWRYLHPNLAPDLDYLTNQIKSTANDPSESALGAGIINLRKSLGYDSQ